MGLFVGCELVDWNYIWHSFPTPELQRYIMTHGERPPVANEFREDVDRAWKVIRDHTYTTLVAYT